MANEKDRTRNEPTPMSENEAETVVGGQDPPGQDPPDAGSPYEPCNHAGCSCLYDGGPQCTCSDHTHTV